MGSGIRLVHIMTVPQSLLLFRGQAAFMKEQGLELSMVSSAGEMLERFGAREGVAVYPVEMSRRITPWRDLVSVLKLFRFLRRTRPAVVHSHTPKGGLLGMIAAWLNRTPVRIYHMRGLPFMTATGVRRALLWWTERVSCLLAHQVLCVSHSLREVAVAERLCPPGKIKVLLGGSGNGVDALGQYNGETVRPKYRQMLRTRCGIPDEAFVVGYVGRVVRDKGIVELAEAWRLLRAEFPLAHLMIVGNEEPQDPVPPEVMGRLQSDPRVRLVGYASDTAPFYAAMDLLALPTYREGFPNVVLEAMAMALPVVTTAIPGCTDAVVAGETGRLVPPRDAQALAEAIRSYLTDDEACRLDGRRGRERAVGAFRREAIWAALLGEYRRLLSERRGDQHG